ncbi:hypothetical protein CC86DRAFT_373290 [Ophiobolus disseminans]|uniref:AB hydrolase-1 domain-containing protein n=1 Tax=Ophiobolus disseminans TaxID=1469910 RepID=A0A6A6ZMI7_9PLEO|nr:hypothetical protein CC86DRAFT_373290 [Ophiobolus disseminans]
MRKTIVLCFIHGFKGGDDTFGNFPSHLKAILQHALPKVSIITITYPKYETRGDLNECVARFKEWLTDKVIDLEVANSTPSPTVDPSVHTILVGHSMGGLVAAETLLSITGDQPLHSLKNSQIGSTMLEEHSTLMFPYIQGILAFDTPYLGIAPGVVAHGAEKHWQTANSAYSAYSNLASAFGWGGKDTAPGAVDTSRMLPAPSAVNDINKDAASAPMWQRYGRVAMFAGAAGAIAAGGAAAYMKRDQISEGLGWATSHLEFIGALARPEEMQKRLAKVTKLTTSEFGFTNMYTTLGRAVNAQQQTQKESWTGKVAGKDRTFCNLPKGELRNFFIPAVNDKGTAETWAHMNMFEPKNNPGYYTLSETAKEKIIEWAENDWYESSEGPLVGEVGEEAEIVERQEVDEAMQKEADARETEDEFVDLKRGAGTPLEEKDRGKRREL